jgi:hypothetical protein
MFLICRIILSRPYEHRKNRNFERERSEMKFMLADYGDETFSPPSCLSLIPSRDVVAVNKETHREELHSLF